ncbi:calcineurin B-like protein 8 [Aegilops tauschii subsp. strangulata]|uniref:calcineurin B-like protein 8 n=1 Tax=Aegilops tauschii subsp. strangulata TaxID=200361 RepID=UPI001ABC3644|nr:calcineurin B-like protein 7 [Aegilops tauschii subsp. strangulata]XP_044437247.1 calcineurin B-like protein 7 [Triticum aestivum]
MPRSTVGDWDNFNVLLVVAFRLLDLRGISNSVEYEEAYIFLMMMSNRLWTSREAHLNENGRIDPDEWKVFRSKKNLAEAPALGHNYVIHSQPALQNYWYMRFTIWSEPICCKCRMIFC